MSDKKNFLSSTFCLCIMLTASVCSGNAYGQKKKFETKSSTFTINAKGYLVSILDKRSGKEYCPKGLPSALLTLVTREKQILPVSAEFNPGDILLRYPNGATAWIDVQLRPQYLRLRLLSLDNAPDVDNIVWGLTGPLSLKGINLLITNFLCVYGGWAASWAAGDPAPAARRVAGFFKTI